MAFFIRRLVSKQKRRFQEDGFDLDLAYITDRIIAMALPAEGKESVYRNPISEVKRFIATYHPGRCRVYNLCCERSYGAEKLGADVVCYALEDHQAPPLDVFEGFCKDADAYLSENEENVIAVHCKAGKGRTGCMICAFLVYKGLCQSAEEAMDLYGRCRTYNGKGLTIPSQRRYVEYFSRFLSSGMEPPYTRMQLQRLTLTGLLPSQLEGLTVVLSERRPDCIKATPFVVLNAAGFKNAPVKKLRGVDHSPLLHIKGKDATVDFSPEYAHSPDATVVEGDLKIQVFQGVPRKRNCLFHTWISTRYVQGNCFSVCRWQLDRVKPQVPSSASLEVTFKPVQIVEAAASRTSSSSTSKTGSPRVPMHHFSVETESPTHRKVKSSPSFPSMDPFLQPSSKLPEADFLNRSQSNVEQYEYGENGVFFGGMPSGRDMYTASWFNWSVFARPGWGLDVMAQKDLTATLLPLAKQSC